MYKIWTIYFAQGIESKRIKIGKTTRNPETVLASLNSSEEFVVLKTVKGTLALTRDLHAEFEMLQVEGLQKGWYTSSPELLDRIESMEDFDGGEPPKPEPKPEYKEYKPEVRSACCGCGTWLSDEYNKKPIDFLTLGESETYIDYGDIHGEMEIMNADAWSKSDDYLCRECALKGGLTNLIYPLFSTIRENLAPFWTQANEKFLSMCVDTTEIHETTRYIWVKARVFTRKCLAAFIEQNPSGNLNATIRFIFAEIRRIDSGNLSERKSNPSRL
ncbi:GIY-YIG nuclease family protein [Candidatus Poribacteria bacterium]|nr:GIY-YIG nuclease family protein [Candidatus Poribacteria bacterium]MYK23944.1 GIY-YIG nuclease family protein [Candidatus Poribacteria bacterium]